MNWLALDGIEAPPEGWFAVLAGQGYHGVQFVEPLRSHLVDAARASGLAVCGSGRVNQPADAERLAVEASRYDLECLTLHVGWGMEDDDAGARLIEAVLDASGRSGVPLYVETHRATLFQDMWRSVGFARCFPELRFNGDFSHWYTGQEMVYGDFAAKLAFIRPVIEATDFMHARIGNPGCMQVDIGSMDHALKLPFVDHFRSLWTAVFTAFLARKRDGDFTVAAELLAADIYYARTFGGIEESDRLAQSKAVLDIAELCYADAVRASIP